MSRREQKPYHDDDRYMPIVDYSTPRRGEDLTSPNAGQPANTVVLPSTPIHTTTRVIEDSVFITERLGPVTLGPGEVIDVLSLTSEAGDIVSIEVVTDNPYTGVYLEMDDYKNKDRVGITAAELIMKNRMTPSNREFYAEDMREDGTFVVKYSPKTPDPYTDRIKIQVRNDLPSQTVLRGHNTNQRLKMRNGLPTPLQLGHPGGWYVTHPNIKQSRLFNVHNLLNKLGKSQYSNPIKNIEGLEDPTKMAGAYHPFMNSAGDIGEHVIVGPVVANQRLVSGEPGERILSSLDAINSVPWPGKVVNGTFVPSQQQFILYGDRTEDITTAIANSSEVFANELMPASEFGTGDPVFVKHDDTVYYLGVTTFTTYYYDVSEAAMRKQNSDIDAFWDNGDGAIVFTVSPGLPFKLPKVDIVLDETAQRGVNFNGFGFATAPTQGVGNMLIHEVVVRRKRTKTQLL